MNLTRNDSTGRMARRNHYNIVLRIKKRRKMRITKLIDKTPYIDANGKWNVFCQVLKGCTYTYGVVMCDTMEEAFALKEGQIIDAKKFDHRIKNV